MTDKAPPAVEQSPARVPPARADKGGGESTSGRTPNAVLALQRSAGNRAVAQWAGHRGGAPLPLVVQRLRLEEGPPLAPGNYRYGPQIVSLDPKALQSMLSGMAGRDGLKAERTWEQAFLADMHEQSDSPRKFEDGDQSIAVEPALATRTADAQRQLETQAGATQTQFQQQLLTSVGGLLDGSEKKLQAEGRRYGFPTDESILRPQPVSAGQAEVQPVIPGSSEVTGLAGGAHELVAGKAKLKAARDKIVKSGPILGDAMRPTVLEPAVREYHELLQRVCGKFPLLASIERDEARLTELAAGATGPATGPAATVALQKARDEIRKELADKMSNIAVVRDGMKEPDKIDRFWLDANLRANTKRSMNIAAGSFHDAAVEEKVAGLQADADFEQHLKQAIGVALLVASFVPGVAPVAGAIGLVMGGLDVVSAFQQYYWEQAAAGTAMEKAEAISQTEPSLFSLAFSIATGLLEGVAEAKALEGAIDVFKVLRTAYREARAAEVAVKVGGGVAKATGVAEAMAATERLRTTADTASGKPGLGDHVVASLGQDVKAAALSLDRALKLIENPALKELILKGDPEAVFGGKTLMDLATEDPNGLAEDYRQWQRRTTPESKGRSFTDWLRDVKDVHQHGVLNNPAGILEYGLDDAGARRSFEACLREDPTREAGIWRDPATGENVCVQGGPGYVESGWMADGDSLWSGRTPRWELVLHNHPNRGIAIDRIPSQGDFGALVSPLDPAAPRPIRSAHTWTDPASKLRFETEFGYTPGAPRPWWARYRVDDGTMRIASFAEPPQGAGYNAYQDFINNFHGLPGDPVPGGNLPPVGPPPLPRP